MSDLPTSISTGSTGHIDDHESLHLQWNSFQNMADGVLVVRDGTTIAGWAAVVPADTTLVHAVAWDPATETWVADNTAFLQLANIEGGTATFSGDGTITTFTITHSLGVIPSVRSVWAETSAAAGNKFVGNVTDTTVDVVFLAAPASGTDNVILGYDFRV